LLSKLFKLINLSTLWISIKQVFINYMVLMIITKSIVKLVTLKFFQILSISKNLLLTTLTLGLCTTKNGKPINRFSKKTNKVCHNMSLFQKILMEMFSKKFQTLHKTLKLSLLIKSLHQLNKILLLIASNNLTPLSWSN
jgi:hypothetical protein